MSTCARCGEASSTQARFCGACGAALGPVADTPAVRKHIVVFFVDIVGSTSLGESLDPEPLRRYLKRYFDSVSAVLWAHGATVEKFIGDAVMAVFGVPVAREDDATRALRAAVELHAAVAELSVDLDREYGRVLQVRVGINGGEVYVSRHADGQFSVTGDTVNVAARLEQAAGPGETLVGGTVASLAGRNAPLVPVEPLRVKGKAETLAAWRLVPAVEVQSTASDMPLVGREEELADLNRIADRVTRRRDSCLVTVLGAAGIGKSRLVAEFIAGRPDLLVLGGHCQSYGSGGTFWPLAQVLERLGDDWRAMIGSALPDPAEAARVVDRLATAIGEADGHTGLDDIVWAARRLVETLSRDRPVALVWEDLQWAQPTFIDLLDRLSARLRSVPVLMICVARPDLLMAHPMWGGGRSCAMSLELGPLSGESLRELVEELTTGVVAHGAPSAGTVEAPSPDIARLQIVSEGNPLIALQMLEFAATGGEVPVTVQTLFEAQLDRLAAVDRLFCECAAVMGRDFWPDGVRFAADAPNIPEETWKDSLDRLIRLDVLQPTAAQNLGRPGYRFTHTLLMETVYRGTPKSQRSRWHGRVADWVGSAPHLTDGERAELTAVHLERAHSLLTEVNRDDPQAAVLAVRAADAAVAASGQSLARSDFSAAARMLAQAQRLLPAGDPRHVDVARNLFDSLVALGAHDRLEVALETTEAALVDDPVWRALRPVPRAVLDLHRGGGTQQAAHDIAGHAIAALSELDAPGALMWAYELSALAHGADLQFSAAERAARAALDCARAAGDRRAERRMLCGLCELAFWGPMPVADARALCDATLPMIETDLQLTAPVLAIMGALAAMAGELDRAEDLIGSAHKITVDLDLRMTWTLLRAYRGLVSTLVGDHAAAAVEYLTAADELATHGSVALLYRTMAARAQLAGGNVAAARATLGWPPPAGVPSEGDDAHYLGLWYGLAARLAAAEGDAVRAREWAAMGVAMAGTAENPRSYADALIDLAAVQRQVGNEPAARTALTAARQQLIRKGATRCQELASRWADPPGAEAVP